MTFDPVALIELAFAQPTGSQPKGAQPNGAQSAGVGAWLDRVGAVVVETLAPDGHGGLVVRGARERRVVAGQGPAAWTRKRLQSWADEAELSLPAQPGLTTQLQPGGELRWVVTAGRPLAFVALAPSVEVPDSARERLWRYLAVHLALGFDAAIGASPRETTDAMAVWRGVLAGDWTFVEQRTGDGQRQMVAEPLPPGDPRRVTRRQRQVAFYASLGCSNKEIGYHLALADNTVSAHLKRALGKMGIPSRTVLVRIAVQVTAEAEARLTRAPRTSGVYRL